MNISNCQFNPPWPNVHKYVVPLVPYGSKPEFTVWKPEIGDFMKTTPSESEVKTVDKD